MRTTDYLTALKARAGIESDYGLAKLLGVPKQTVSNYRNGRSSFDATMAAKVAELLELDAIQVIADAEIERATKPEARALWERIAAKVAAGVLVAIAAKVAAGVLVAIGAGVAIPPPATAAQSAPSVVGPVCYVKRRRAWWGAAIPFLPPLDRDPFA